MTNTEHVIQQVETVLSDKMYPPTLSQRELLNTILYNLCNGSPEYRSSK
jgi:hypothetical protein